MHHVKQAACSIEADGGLPPFVLARGIDQNEQGIAKYRGRFLEPDTMLAPVALGLGRIPHECITVQVEADIHAANTSKSIDKVNTHATGATP